MDCLDKQLEDVLLRILVDFLRSNSVNFSSNNNLW